MTGAAPSLYPSIPGADRGLGANLLFLLGVPSRGRVLIVGDALRGWQEVFPGSRFETGFPSCLPSERADLVLYHGGCADRTGTLRRHLQLLRAHLAPGAPLLVFAPNRYAAGRWQRSRRGAAGMPTRPACGVTGYRQALAAAGLAGCREFLAFPGMETVEELVDPAWRKPEVPFFGHPLLRLAGSLGFLPLVADGSVFLHVAADGAGGPRPARLADLLAEPGGEGAGNPELARIDLRRRGALVLFVRAAGKGREVVVRVASDPGTRTRIQHHRRMLVALREGDGPGPDLRLRLPEPLAERIVAGRTVQVESLLPGVPAWKANRRPLRRRIYRDADAFIWRLQLVSRVSGRLDAPGQAGLYAGELTTLDHCPTAGPNLRRTLAALRPALGRRLELWKGVLVAAHGDYGYGNILVDPRVGRLTGVVDWEGGRLRELPGIDRLNLDIQRVRSERGCGPYPAFVAASRPVIARGGLDPDRGYATVFGIDAGHLPMLLHVSLLRYIRRAANYPEVLAEEEEDYLQALSFLREVAPL